MAKIKKTTDSKVFAAMNFDLWLDEPIAKADRILQDINGEYDFYLGIDPVPDGYIDKVKVYKHTLQYISIHPSHYFPASVIAVGQQIIVKPLNGRGQSK